MIILQGFYWNCLENWYKELDVLVESIAEKGFDGIWLPPPSKGMSGKLSMGYDIKEHYNLDSRFGDKKDLINLIEKCHKNDIEVMADLVMGHMLGGKKELNPYVNEETYTRFDEERFPKDYRHFHYGDNAVNEFGETINYYSDDEYMKKGLIRWVAWLKDEIGYDSFRLGNLKDMDWDFIKSFIKEFDDVFIVGEYWDGSDDKLNEVIDYMDVQLFNFPLFYRVKEMCMNPEYSMRKLENVSKYNKVNFLSNHDIERFERDNNKDAIAVNKELGYAYIMFQEEPVVIAWQDYFEYDLREELDRLIEVRKKTEDNNLEVIFVDDNIYHAKRGSYEIIINNSCEDIDYQGNKISSRSYNIKEEIVDKERLSKII